MIVTFHGADYSRISYAKGGMSYRKMFERVNLVTAPSRYAVKKVIGLGCPPNKIIKMPSGIDLELFQFKERQYRPSEPIRILTVARFIEKKGLPYALQAIYEISRRHHIHYEIVGRGDAVYRDELLGLTKKLNIEKIVTFSEPRTARELSLTYQRSHIFLMASHTATDGDEESQGMVLAEAQACGMPVVATRHNGFPESMVEGESGFLATEKSVSSLVEQLEKMIRSPDRWPAMGRRGRNFVEDSLDIKELARRLETQYLNLVHGLPCSQ